VFNDVLGEWEPNPDTGWDSGVFPVGSDHNVDLSTFTGFPRPLPEGVQVRPEIRVRAGDTVHPPPDSFIVYRKNGQTATWIASGTTLDVHVRQV
jgi:hypothetical protein